MFYHAPKAVTYINLSNLSNVTNVLPYAQGSDLRWTYSNVTYHYCRFMIGHSLGRMGIYMEEHTCEAELPHINEKYKRKIRKKIGCIAGRRRRTTEDLFHLSLVLLSQVLL